MPSLPQRQRALYLLVGLIVGAAATGLVWATNGGSSEVRLAARVLEDGRVEVALQQRPPELALPAAALDQEPPAWGPLERPTRRFLAPDAEPGRWFHSSPLSLTHPDIDADTAAQAPGAAPTHLSIGPYEIVGTPTISRPFDQQ
ncbi:MAG: hypothetical protein OXG27_02905, partial [Chloroflexi bacterium]|nr:hypothetical protein [Chloroflexota bacterium]